MELEAVAAKCAAAADTLEQRANAMPAVQADMVGALALLCEDYSRRVDGAYRMNLYEFRAVNRLRTQDAGRRGACRRGHHPFCVLYDVRAVDYGNHRVCVICWTVQASHRPGSLRWQTVRVGCFLHPSAGVRLMMHPRFDFVIL